MIFELMNGRRCSALQRDLPQPLCAAMSPDGAGFINRDAVVAREEDLADGEDRAEPEDCEEGDAKGKLEDKMEMRWPPRRGSSSFITGGARRYRYRSLRDPFPTVGSRPPDPRTNRDVYSFTA